MLWDREIFADDGCVDGAQALVQCGLHQKLITWLHLPGSHTLCVTARLEATRFDKTRLQLPDALNLV